MKKLTGHQAIEAAQQDNSIQLHKYTDPTEDAREVSLEEAEEIAREDASLIWCEVEK